jgi:hypothetical protein
MGQTSGADGFFQSVHAPKMAASKPSNNIGIIPPERLRTC